MAQRNLSQALRIHCRQLIVERLLSLSGRDDIGIIANPNRRAKRLTMRFDQRAGAFRLSHPPRVAIGDLQNFVDSNRQWILRNYREPAALDDGVAMWFRGRRVELATHDRTSVSIDGDRIHVGTRGRAAALRGFLRAEAQLYAPPVLHHYAREMQVDIAALRWRDAKSRWGSCDRNGVIMLNWRLIMAPDTVFDYVIAHEVAHRMHMDHSVNYWRFLGQFVPDYAKRREWLRQNGAELQALPIA